MGETTMSAAIIHPKSAIPEIVVRRDQGRKEMKAKVMRAIKNHILPRAMG